MPFTEVCNTYIRNTFAAENSFRHRKQEEMELPVFEKIKPVLPQPYWKGHDSAVACYWKAWEIAFGNLLQPTEENGFVANYIDSAFNKCIFMWDSCFMLLFARYGCRAFNFQHTLDNFYAKQHDDGFICRAIHESNGYDRFHRFDPVSTGPNIMPFAEWEYYLHFRDKERLSRVFPVLVAYHQWLRQYRTWRDGSYWSSGWGCGMDNQPRLQEGYHEAFSHGHQVWADTCMQQLFSAKLLVRTGWELGRAHEIPDVAEEIELLTNYVNQRLWDDKTAFYYDLWRGDERNSTKSIGAYWSLLAGAVPEEKLKRFTAHLENPAEFKRPHRIPTLSADHPGYDGSSGGYWRGGVWAPTNYMVLKGLDAAGYDSLAHEIGLNHLEQVVRVFEATGTLWENYSPEQAAAGSPAKPDFVGWSGLSPIAVLLEFVFGIKAHVAEARLEWRVRLTEEHGVRQFPFGKAGMLDLWCGERSSPAEKPEIRASSNIPLKLVIQWDGGEEGMQL
ncbi:MAG: glycoside hydrolase [Paenibacillaceae bacterium]|jgi:glycogen debranching enzyme|nr:glycoside hydrolase [Paenibacillaceae bacterium]